MPFRRRDNRSTTEKALRETHRRLTKARQDMVVLQEQLSVLAEVADDAQTDAIVSESAQATHDARDARRHADAVQRLRDELQRTITELERRQDALLDALRSDSETSGPQPPPSPTTPDDG